MIAGLGIELLTLSGCFLCLHPGFEVRPLSPPPFFLVIEFFEMLWVENRLLVWEVSSMDTNKNLEWLKNIRSLARDDLHLANVMLDTMPVGASLTEPDILTPPSIKPDTRPNVDEIELLLTGKG